MLNMNQWVNGQPRPIRLQLQNAMFYPNAYCANNPVKYVDPDGRKIVISGDDVDNAVNQLNSVTSKEFIIIKNQDGSLKYEGKAITQRDKFIKKGNR